MDRASKVRAATLAALLCGSIVGGMVLQRSGQPNTPKFCDASLPLREISGRTVAVQDKDPHGTTCDGDQTTPGMDTLGIDCNVRSPDGSVLETVASTRQDGTCGTARPAP